MTRIYPNITVYPHYLLSFFGVGIAVIALIYSGWRYEVTEENYNVRAASFEILKELASLQLLVDQAYYDKNTTDANPIKGWVSVSLMNDLSVLTNTLVQAQTQQLFTTWQVNWETLTTKKESNAQITAQIKQTRLVVLETLNTLK